VARVYSSELFSAGSLGSGSDTLGTVPTGHVWVVRNIAATYVGDPSFALSGFTLSLGSGAYIWSVGPLAVVPGFTYPYAGRQVAPSGGSIIFTSSDPANWTVVGGGYDLVLP